MSEQWLPWMNGRLSRGGTHAKAGKTIKDVDGRLWDAAVIVGDDSSAGTDAVGEGGRSASRTPNAEGASECSALVQQLGGQLGGSAAGASTCVESRGTKPRLSARPLVETPLPVRAVWVHDVIRRIEASKVLLPGHNSTLSADGAAARPCSRLMPKIIHFIWLGSAVRALVTPPTFSHQAHTRDTHPPCCRCRRCAHSHALSALWVTLCVTLCTGAHGPRTAHRGVRQRQR